MSVPAALLIASTLSPLSGPASPADERSALDAIYVLLEQHRYPEAKDQWNQVGARIQQSLRAASGQALAPAAEKQLKRRVAEAWFIQGLLTVRFGEKDDALRLLRDADGLGFPPLDSPLMVLAADGLQQLHEPALAAQAYREVLKRAPQNATARLGLGVSLQATGQLAAAEQELEETLRRAPETPQAHYTLGAVLFDEKRPDEAKAHLERELALDPRCAACMAKLAHIAYLEGDDGVCASWLAKASALDPAHDETGLVSGMLAIRSGRYDAAVRHLSRLVERSPANPQAQYQLGLAYQRVGNPTKAREHLDAYRRLIEEEKARTIGVRGSEP